jgi:DNA-binding transcriptional LysR family regulator
MELRHLRYFVAVAEKLNFTEAARSLHIAQPSLSLQIQDLERSLGVSLIQRNNRSVKLTPAGEVFLQEARHLLGQTEQAIANTHRADRGEIGELRIGFIYVAVQQFLAGLLNRFQHQAPKVTVHLTHMANVEQIKALQTHQIDVGFARMFNHEAYTDLIADCIFKDTLLVAVADDHPLAQLETVPVDAFQQYPVVPYARNESPLLFQSVLQQLGPASFTAHKVNEPYMLDTALMLVEAGFGITLVPGCAKHLRHGRLKFLPIEVTNDFTVPSVDLFLVRRKDAVGNPIIDSFVTLVQQFVAL